MKTLLHLLFLLLPLFQVVAQDPDIEENERKLLEEIYRTSDQAGQIPVARHDRNKKTKRVSVPAGAFRVGCICMDETVSDTRSTGACSGHGGVRFWVYRTKEGDTVHVLTGRHERHPQALDAREMSELSKKQSEKVNRLRQTIPAQSLSPGPVMVMPAAPVDDGVGWGDVTLISVGAVAAFFIIRLVLRWASGHQNLVRYALRLMLRHRKRPVKEPRRKAARKKRVSAGTKVRVCGAAPEQKRPDPPEE